MIRENIGTAEDSLLILSSDHLDDDNKENRGLRRALKRTPLFTPPSQKMKHSSASRLQPTRTMASTPSNTDSPNVSLNKSTPRFVSSQPSTSPSPMGAIRSRRTPVGFNSFRYIRQSASGRTKLPIFAVSPNTNSTESSLLYENERKVNRKYPRGVKATLSGLIKAKVLELQTISYNTQTEVTHRDYRRINESCSLALGDDGVPILLLNPRKLDLYPGAPVTFHQYLPNVFIVGQTPQHLNYSLENQ